MQELKQELMALSLQSGTNVQDGQEYIHLLDDMLQHVKTIDDLYFFFDKTIVELRLQISKVQPLNNQPVNPPPEDGLLRNEGSLTDIFLRRCILAFNQLMFEELQRLYDAFLIYREGGVPSLSKTP